MISPSIALLPALLLQTQAPPQAPPANSNAFANFETRYYANGLKLWYKTLANDPVVSISLALPAGADRDPPGLEQLAHFTEHMLFSDQPGLTEEEIKREIEERGGVYNASVSADRSFYYVRIGREHALFALDWLYRILAPHAMTPEVVERQREPVALEVRARPRQFFDWISAYYLNPPALRLPGFWEREFGINTLASRDYYPYASLHRISSPDLRWYYDTYYVPSLMTLTVIGDVHDQPMLEKIAETFALLPRRDPPPSTATPIDPGRYRQNVYWSYRSNVYYDDRFKFYAPSAADEVMLIFVSRLLSKRLNDRLRFGERKATYGLHVGVVRRGAAAYLRIAGGIRTAELEYARRVIAAELSDLRQATSTDFEADRATIIEQLLVGTASAQDLEDWVQSAFYDRRIHEDFPDLASRFATTSQLETQRFATANLIPERRVLYLIRPIPITQGAVLATAFALLWLTVSFARRRLTQPIDMKRIRYVARFRLPRLYSLLAGALLALLFALAGRLLFYGFQLIADYWLVTVDSFVFQWSVYGLMMMSTAFLIILILARIPRKLILFDNELRIKCLSYRSVPIPANAIAELSLLRFGDVWLSRRLWRCVPLTFGMLGPGIYLRRRGGHAYFFNVRQPVELFSLLGQLANVPGPAESETSGQAVDPT